jgi:oligopeptidase A
MCYGLEKFSNKTEIKVNMTVVSLPKMTQIDIDTFTERLNALLQGHLQQIDSLLQENSSFDWDNLMQPLEDMDDALERFWSPLAHLHAVVNSPALRDCYQSCLPKLTAYEAAIGHNQVLYDAIQSIDKRTLNKIQNKIMEDTLRDFELSGVALSSEKKHRFEAIQARLSELSHQFENNVLDASQAFCLHITDERRLLGLPAYALDGARALAEEKGVSGWILNLEIPCYQAILTHAEDRALREEIYYAYITRASDQGPFAKQYDNTAIMNETLALRFEKANLLGFVNYAELSLVTKMAESPDQVLDFLSDLGFRTRAKAEEEFYQLRMFATDIYQMSDIEPWDIAYLSEKRKQSLYSISEEELRAFFPLSKVISGLFAIVNKLYGMTISEIIPIDAWHPDVTCYQVSDEDNRIRGYIYVDLFARQNKRGGAWMDSSQGRRKLVDGNIQLPIATLTCNFAKAAMNKPPTLSHDEVLTLFHEFGHCFHHVLTQVDYLSASGINSVEWDAVELPSQFFENWCWEEEALNLLTAHVDNGQTLPAAVFQKLLAAKNFQSAMAMMRQLEFSLFDFLIHQKYQQTPEFIDGILSGVRRQTTVIPIASYNCFQHSFSHIFSGGYAAGYYSYKWAEVLSSDAYSRFEQEGLFNEKTGRDFLHKILEVGGSRNALDAFVDFRGRKATIDALLRHNGIQ